METRISRDFNGMTQEAVNVEMHNNVIKPIDPARNAVIVDFIETPNEEGEMVTGTIITIECKDDHLYEEMKEYALSLVSGA